ncbi:MAG: bacteriohopanetetrol glucosamine biosynthesis glycosyltransferase HpnI [Acidobacteria bacterium]|nr:bacteriohopanetetrol glucosamine biosynthesis glycosyltransferase HpnI [Acidobacteriota bacterium]
MHTHLHLVEWFVSVGAIISLLYYLAVLFSAWRYFRRPFRRDPNFAPPVSILKPVRGLDREAYENFASFCNLDYPQYEILFGVSDADDPVVPVIQKLIEGYPDCNIRLLIGSSCKGWNSKVSKLCRLSREAQHPILVISDSDIRVQPDYLRSVVSPFRNSKVGAVTCMYRMQPESKLGSEIEAVGLTSDFLAGVIVARQLEGVKFALGATIAVTAERLKEIGGFEAIADCFSDDFELGRRIVDNGHDVELIPYTVTTVSPSQGALDAVKHQLRWAVGLRNSRPWGQLGRLLTQALPWVVAATLVQHTWEGTAGFLGAYVALRLAVAWTVGVWGLKDPLIRKRLWLVPAWDALAFFILAVSFSKRRIEWRGTEFYVRKGRLSPAPTKD